MADLPRLSNLLDTQPLTRLLDRLVQRLERGDGLYGTVSLKNPSEDEREAIGRLFGKPGSRGQTLRVSLAQLDGIIRNADVARDLREAVEAIRGPQVDRRRQRREVNARWDAVWESAQSRLAGRAQLLLWLDSLRGDGTLRRLAPGDPEAGSSLLARAIDVLERIPSTGMLLTELAASACGDSHALDHGAPVGTLVLRALGCLRGKEASENPSKRRALWEEFGVACDELSAPVLVLNLPGHGGTCLGRALAIHAENGEPYRISIRQLIQEPEAISPSIVNRTAYVCENVSVLAAAARRLGPRCPVMVCVEGNPRIAAQLLLDRLRGGGTRLRYHGDFDWPGITIANLVCSKHVAEPWRMSKADYEAFADRGTSLIGRPVKALWDSHLSEVMHRRRKVVHEELMMESLIHDLEVAVRDP